MVAAIVPLVMQILPLLPGLVRGVLDITDAIRGDPGTPEETRAELDRLSQELQAVAAKVRAAPLPPPS